MAGATKSVSEVLGIPQPPDPKLTELRRVMAELANRKIEGLRLYRPMGFQQAFHESQAPERIIRGANRCLAGSQEIYDPVSRRLCRIDSIGEDFHVLSMNPECGELKTKRAGRPFIKGRGPLYEFTLSSGEKISSTMEHRVVSIQGRWVTMREAMASSLPLACVKSECRDVADNHKKSQFSLRTEPPLLESIDSTAFALTRRQKEVSSNYATRSSFLSGRREIEILLGREPQSSRTFFRSPSQKSPAPDTFLPDRLREESSCESWRRFRPASSFRPRSILGNGRSIRGEDDLRSWRIIQDCLGDYLPSRHSCDERLPSDREDGQLSSPSQVDARGHSRCCWRQDGQESESACSRPCRSSCRRSTTHDALATEGHACAAGFRSERELLSDSTCSCGTSSPIQGRSSSGRCTESEEALQECRDADSEFYSLHPQSFVVGNQGSATIVSARPIGIGDIWDISVGDWSNYVCAGLVNANSGKTLAAAAEIARAITGQDPFAKYPLNDGICYIVGKQGKELAQVLFPLIFRPGAFKMIRDLQTKEWRSWNPTDPEDLKRKAEAKRSPAFVPKRMIASIAWEDKKKDLPAVVTTTTGWKTYFYSSEGKPTQGTAIDLGLFDEEILNEEWYTEVSARLIDKGGRFIWSATPQAGTEKLFALHERAEDQVEKNIYPRTVEEFYCNIAGNQYMAETDRQLFIQKHEDDENTYNVRVLGGFAMLSGRVYSEYTSRVHEVAPFKIPANWTRYVAVDPGTQVGAVLYGAVPPPEEGDFFYLYDELYLKDCTAAIMGREMGKKVGDQTFYTFLIDMTDARKRDRGSGIKLVEQYSEQLKANRVQSTLTGSEFEPGYSDTRSGLEAVRHWLRIRSDGTPKIRVFSTLKNLSKEMTHYRREQVKVNGRHEFTDKPVKKRDHLVDCLRYLVQRDPIWVPPRLGKGRTSGVYAAHLQMQAASAERDRMNGGGGTLVLGPRQHDD